MNWIFQRSLMGLLVAILMVAGCANTYRDAGFDGTPLSELTTLSIASRGASVRKIDGKLQLGKNFRHLELAPGVRTITVFLVSGYTTTGDVTIEFDAVAGEQYELHAKVDRENWQWLSWVVESGRDVIVSRQVAE